MTFTFTAVVKATAAKFNFAACCAHAKSFRVRLHTKYVAGRRGMDINFATDSRVALDMLTKRRGGTAHAIHKKLKRIEDEGSTLKLWWSSDQHRGIAKATRSRRGPEKCQRSFQKSGPPSRGGCSRRKRQRHPWRGGKPNGTKARQEG
jgi:hypothetical protein